MSSIEQTKAAPDKAPTGVSTDRKRWGVLHFVGDIWPCVKRSVRFALWREILADAVREEVFRKRLSRNTNATIK